MIALFALVLCAAPPKVDLRVYDSLPKESLEKVKAALAKAGFPSPVVRPLETVRASSVIYAAKGSEGAAKELAAALPGGARVEPLTWKSDAPLVVALGVFSVEGEPGGTELHFDGVYLTEPEKDVLRVLRLYADGTVLAISTTAKARPGDLQKWFKKGNDTIGQGTYQLDGNELSFSARWSETKEEPVDFAGLVKGNALVLSWYSHLNDHQGQKTYTFVPFPK